MIKLIVIVGPTGVGKTEIAIDLAKQFGGEIVNADSRQIYRQLVIGASKPSAVCFAQIPHHLFDAAELDDPWDAKRFQHEADRVLEGIMSRGHCPIVVGGTGLYVRALLYGLFEGPSADESLRDKIRREIETMGLPAVYEKLAAHDPEVTKTIHPNDEMRIVRALEVFRLTGRPITELQAEQPFGDRRYDALKLGITMDRAELYKRIDARVDEMMAQGLKKEVETLRMRTGDLPILRRSIGYKEWFLKSPSPRGGEGGGEGEIVAEIKKNSRHLAKRQLCWFRPEKDITWFDTSDHPGIIKATNIFLS